MSAALPAAEAQSPACGACSRETDYDGDIFACYDCGLGFDRNDLSAFYLDDEAVLCDAGCNNSWHGPNRINRGYGYECVTCALPTQHASMHYHACKLVEVSA